MIHSVVSSFTLCLNDARHDQVVYGAEFVAMFLAKGYAPHLNRSTSIASTDAIQVLR